MKFGILLPNFSMQTFAKWTQKEHSQGLRKVTPKVQRVQVLAGTDTLFLPCSAGPSAGEYVELLLCVQSKTSHCPKRCQSHIDTFTALRTHGSLTSLKTDCFHLCLVGFAPAGETQVRPVNGLKEWNPDRTKGSESVVGTHTPSPPVLLYPEYQLPHYSLICDFITSIAIILHMNL